MSEEVATRDLEQPRRFLSSPFGALLLVLVILGVVIGMAALSGYQAGISQRERIAATVQFEELQLQYRLAIEDMAAGRYSMAVNRFEYIQALAPDYPGLAERLAQARAASDRPVDVATSAPTSTPVGENVQPEELFAAAVAAYEARDWEASIQRITALRAKFPDHKRAQVDGMLFVSLRNRGIGYIQNDALELGIFDLEQAAAIGPLDVEAQQHMQWAALYVNGMAYWGLNWPRAIEVFSTLHLIAPYFKDTMPRLHAAHVALGDELSAAGDPCGAGFEYEAALEIQANSATADKRQAAEQACSEITPTPEGGVPEGTPDEMTTDSRALTSTASVDGTERAQATPQVTETPP